MRFNMIMNSLRKCKLPPLSCEFASRPVAVCALISSFANSPDTTRIGSVFSAVIVRERERERPHRVGSWGYVDIGPALNALNFCAKCNCILFYVPRLYSMLFISNFICAYFFLSSYFDSSSFFFCIVQTKRAPFAHI